MRRLVDTGVLLRLFDRSDPGHQRIAACLKRLRAAGDALVVSPQNVAEFWNVSTRPRAARGGYGKSVAETERRVQFLERQGEVIPEPVAAYAIWRGLVVQHGVKGVAVHDCRLVAYMAALGVRSVVTLNPKDFARYPEVEASTPTDLLEGAEAEGSG